MIKILVYAISYNNEDCARKWLECYKDADYFLIIDLESTDNTIDILSEDLRVYSRIPYFDKEKSYVSVQNYALSLAKDMANHLKKEGETWLILNFNLKEFLEKDGIQKIKEGWDDSYLQGSVIQKSGLLKGSVNREVVKITTLGDKNTWVCENGSIHIKRTSEENKILKTKLKLEYTLDFGNTYVHGNVVDLLRSVVDNIEIEELSFIKDALLYFKEKESADEFNSIFYPLIFLLKGLSDKIFGVNKILCIYVLCLMAKDIDGIFTPSRARINIGYMYNRMQEEFKKLPDIRILFKKIPYQYAMALMKQENAESQKNLIVSLLEEALNLHQNTYFEGFYPDIDDSYNSEILKLIEEYSD